MHSFVALYRAETFIYWVAATDVGPPVVIFMVGMVLWGCPSSSLASIAVYSLSTIPPSSSIVSVLSLLVVLISDL